MNRSRWPLLLILILLLLSALFYYAQILLFHQPRVTFFYMLQDLAFLPIQVLLVTLILNQLLQRRERQEMHNKLNMVIGAFYSEMGEKLLKMITAIDANIEQLRPLLKVQTTWTDRDFATARQHAQQYTFRIDCCLIRELSLLKSFLLEQRPFMLALLENPNLLEHETFTDLLWAVSHLMEELAFRDTLEGLPAADYAHLAGDTQRVYALLIVEWLSYVQHLRDSYPYIFSLVVRMNPFMPDASPIVRV